jgi:hypothetical protein
MQVASNIKVRFITGFGPIVRETAESHKLYREVLGTPFKVEKEESADYLHTEALQGAKTFALWPLSQAARSCFIMMYRDPINAGLFEGCAGLMYPTFRESAALW